MHSERFQGLALAVLLSIGAGLVWGCLGGLAMSLLGDIVASYNADVREQLVFRRDGTPIILSYPRRGYPRRIGHTLSGKEVELARDDFAFDNGTTVLGPQYVGKRFSELPWSGRIAHVYDDWLDSETWYFMHDGKLRGHGWFVGYDKVEKLKIGYIGRNGFQSDEPPLEQQFPVDGRRMRVYGGAGLFDSNYNTGETDYLLADDGLMEINFKKRSVTLLHKVADPISRAFLEAPSTANRDALIASRTAPAVLLRTPERILVLAADGKEIKNCLLPAELREVNIQWLPLPDGKALILEAYVGHELFWLDADGKVAKHEHVELQTPRPNKFMQYATVSLAVPSPALIAGFTVCYPWGPAECPESLEYSAALSQAFHKVWPVVLATALVSVVLACVCYRRQRRYGLPWAWVWTVLVLLFGLPAYFGYLAHRAWPARLPCPRCGQRVPRDRPACFACGQDFPAPPPKGIEVFA
jgi:hypothetical protein